MLKTQISWWLKDSKQWVFLSCMQSYSFSFHQLMHIHTHKHTQRLLVARICVVSSYTYVRLQTKQVLPRDYVFKLFLGTGGHRHSKQHITAPQTILPFGSPDVSALAGIDLYVWVHVCAPLLLCVGALAFQVLHIDIAEEKKKKSARQQNNGHRLLQIRLSFT